MWRSTSCSHPLPPLNVVASRLLLVPSILVFAHLPLPLSGPHKASLSNSILTFSYRPPNRIPALIPQTNHSYPSALSDGLRSLPRYRSRAYHVTCIGARPPSQITSIPRFEQALRARKPLGFHPNSLSPFLTYVIFVVSQYTRTFIRSAT
ncbi:hypothetical protein M405DRAFT_384010 [Rhizopogon salebrosus TDB-379]|nr:hypothetical protein M405DRAFT_384010 [Rhizopogon salebrosus TDB-379]